ncbi:class II aldolase and Adducin N-terminal domain-containing protein [Mycena olivaceomarginata]|nr:class II aldolase and Adducin N-terminal domain-containing protein [Mycena olivaceomarginata]
MYSKIFITGAVLAGLAAADTAVTDSSVSAAIPASVTAAGIDLLDASHILHFLDVVDAYGHVSVRNPANSSQFLMTYAVAPAQATSQSIVTYAIQNATVLNLTFNPSVKGTAVPTSFAERFIHSEIYKKFPDVNAVIHSHTQEVLPFANQASVPFVAQMHTSPSVGSTGAPVFDIRTVATSLLPDSALHDLLVRTAGLGDALAAKFVTGGQVVLMRGHGMAIRADSIRDAVFTRTTPNRMPSSSSRASSSVAGRPSRSRSMRVRSRTRQLPAKPWSHVHGRCGLNKWTSPRVSTTTTFAKALSPPPPGTECVWRRFRLQTPEILSCGAWSPRNLELSKTLFC